MKSQTTNVSLLLTAVMFLTGCARDVRDDTALAAETHDHGTVDFAVSCNDEARQEMQAGVAMLHHMMYDQALPHFEAAAEADPDCAMAQWGIAMTSFQPLWHPTSHEHLERGKAAVAEARAIGAATEREQAYIAAVHAFFTDPEPAAPDGPADHEARVEAWLDAQRDLHEAHPEDVDAAAFYALAEVAYAQTQFSPGEERDYTRQIRAGELLERYLQEHPEHPGLFHYLIHAYDSTELAPRGEEIARGYDRIAPDVPHALHMPSHIFVRLGLWEETADWNERSATAALRQPVDGLTSLHYPHALDYLMYAYLQLGAEQKARETFEAVRDIDHAQPDFASAYGIAGAQARYYLERRAWQEAAGLEPRIPDALPWDRFPAAEAIVFYARGLGAARSGKLDQAERERDRLAQVVADLEDTGDTYWAHMTEALGDAVEAWTLYERGDTDEALALMSDAADREQAMDKHPVTPGEVLPVRELYAELLLEEGRPDEAVEAFEASLERTPNRRNALRGAARAAEAR